MPSARESIVAARLCALLALSGEPLDRHSVIASPVVLNDAGQELAAACGDDSLHLVFDRGNGFEIVCDGERVLFGHGLKPVLDDLSHQALYIVQIRLVSG